MMLGIAIIVGVVLFYLVVVYILWKIYPHTLSVADELNTSRVGRFFGRIFFAFGLPIIAVIVIFMFLG